MNKDELRKVSYTYGQNTVFEGYFHQWLTKKDSNGSEYAVGLIEDTGGIMREIDSQYIFFKS
jgi:hypothetical protein